MLNSINMDHLSMFRGIDLAGFNFTRWSPSGDYNISLIGEYLHRIPHFDIKLRPINATFDPYNNEYLESLGILVALPGFWLILTLLFFLIFFLCRCCDVNSKKKKSLTCCKCCLFLFTSLSLAIIAVGILGNLQAHAGLVKVSNYTGNLADMVDTLRNETNAVEDMLETKVDEDLNKISRKLIGPLVRNYTVLNVLQEQLLHMRRNVTKGINRIGEINQKIERLDLGFVPRSIDQMEAIRWPATFGVLGVLLFAALLLLCGVCRHSRCLLILFSVLGLLSLVVCWVLASIYLGLAVAGADFCHDPKPFLHRQLSNSVESSIVAYYLDCELPAQLPHYSDMRPANGNNPFRKHLRELRKAIDGFEDGLVRTSDLCETYCPDNEVKQTLRDLKTDAKHTQDTILHLTRLSDCHEVYWDYLHAMSGTCKDLLEGVSLMLASAAATGVVFTLLVLCASHTWINIRKKRPQADGPQEETDPFLPPASATSTATSSGSTKRLRDTYVTGGAAGRPRFSHTPPQTPHFPGQGGPLQVGAQGQLTASRGGHGAEQLAFLTPPPSYEQVGGHPGHQQQAQQQVAHQHGGHIGHPGQQQHHHQQVVHHGQVGGHPQIPQGHGHPGQMIHHQYSSDGPRYVADSDLMMRATQATKF